MKVSSVTIACAVAACGCTEAFLACSKLPRISITQSAARMSLQETSHRADFLRTVGTSLAVAAVAPLAALADGDVTTQSGLQIHKIATGSGQKCDVGDLAAIRFKGRYKDYVFDDIFGTPEPLYFRAGGGNLVKGIDEAIVMMRIGDRWELTIPGPLAFGDKGRSPSPGKPRIPPNATLVYEVELIGLPGKEGDLYDAVGDE